MIIYTKRIVDHICKMINKNNYDIFNNIIICMVFSSLHNFKTYHIYIYIYIYIYKYIYFDIILQKIRYNIYNNT